MTNLYISQLSVQGRLAPFDACVRLGQLVHLIGPNGAGKSSLLLRLAGLINGGGSIHLGTIPFSAMTAHELSMYRACLIQQDLPDLLIPVFTYLGFFIPKGALPDAVDAAVHTLSERLFLSDKLTRPVNQLSGGEWQRVRLASVFLQLWPTLNPAGKLLILDEPATSLDIVQQIALDRLIEEMCAHGILVISSSHELNHTLHHANEVWMIKKGQMVMRGQCKEIMQLPQLNHLFDARFHWGKNDTDNLRYSLT